MFWSCVALRCMGMLPHCALRNLRNSTFELAVDVPTGGRAEHDSHWSLGSQSHRSHFETGHSKQSTDTSTAADEYRASKLSMVLVSWHKADSLVFPVKDSDKVLQEERSHNPSVVSERVLSGDRQSRSTIIVLLIDRRPL